MASGRSGFGIQVCICYILFEGDQSRMFSKCLGCLQKLGWRLMGQQLPRWQQHLDNYCISNNKKYLWCEMLLDNYEIIQSHGTLPKDIEHAIRNTNISSEIVKIITAHYGQDQNVFRFCIELFGSYLKLKYSEIINPSKNTLDKLMKDYQQFLTLLSELFVIYYELQQREILGEELFYKFTLPCLIISFFFRNEDLSSTISAVVRQVHRQNIQKIHFNMQKYSQTEVNDFQVSEKLRLNEKTLEIFNISSNVFNERPYAGAIQILKQIVRVASPTEKLQLVDGLQKQIESTILQFYKRHGIKTDGLEIDFGNAMAILSYIIVQANQTALYQNLQIINNFGPKNTGRNSNFSLQNLITANQIFEKSLLGRLGKEQRQSSHEEEMFFSESKGYFDEMSLCDL